MTDKRNPKRYKNLHTWFKNDTSTNDVNQDVQHEHVNVVIQDDPIEEVEVDIEGNERYEEVNVEHDQNESTETETENVQDYDITSLERDPGKRRPIGSYPLNDRDNIRRSYVAHGPCQPFLDTYPWTIDGLQRRRFVYKWFKEWSWLEYSIEKNKAYCFPCFLFDDYPSRHSSFTDDGFNGWKNMMSKQSGALNYIGGPMSLHNASMRKWENLRNPSRHIERALNKLSTQDLEKNRLRLNATIEAVRLLARQRCSFRGHDESLNSSNGGNFDAVLNSFKRMNIELKKIVNDAPGNAKYICPLIQKQIANILGNKVRTMIRDEIGNSKFAILVDEALDVSNKEQMAIILRFVDREGLIRERFLKVVSVLDTCSQTLKDQICQVLTHYDLQVENIRGQGYDGANNMRGQFNGLQALFLRECPYAYYVHCFAHRLQLSLNAAAKEVHDLWQFFSTLTTIVNFVDSSAKRHSMLRACREGEIADLVAAGTLETGSGKNQACTLQRARATRWGSHLRSITSLFKLFGATRSTIEDLYMNGASKVQGEAKAIGKAMKKFDFVFCLHMMHDIMRTTDFLCQALQRKDLDILNALNFLSLTKEKLQDMRENGWNELITKIEAFCCEYDISMPDISAPYKKGLRSCEMNIMNEHYYRVNVLYSVIDFQLAELDTRFAESSLEILKLSASFDPRYNFRSFIRDDVCRLASKYYPSDFMSYDMSALELECEFFVADLKKDPRFAHSSSLSDLCRRMVELARHYFTL